MDGLCAWVEPPRLFLGSKGNKTLTAGPLYASSLLGVFVLFMHVYYVVGEAFAVVAHRAPSTPVNGLFCFFVSPPCRVTFFTTEAFAQKSVRARVLTC